MASAGAGAGAGATPLGTTTLKKWAAVAVWTYDVGDVENCAICLNALSERCIDCTVDMSAAEECLQVWGTCNHQYHVHCINKFLRSRSLAKCPLCQGDWEAQRVGH
jgi:RING-box protein 1